MTFQDIQKFLESWGLHFDTEHGYSTTIPYPQVFQRMMEDAQKELGIKGHNIVMSITDTMDGETYIAYDSLEDFEEDFSEVAEKVSEEKLDECFDICISVENDMSEESTYLWDNVDDCKEAGNHLQSTDDDGFCNACGNQDDNDEDSEE
jgi:rubrerythrin